MQEENTVIWTYKMCKSSPLILDDIEDFKRLFSRSGYEFIREIPPVEIPGDLLQGSLVFRPSI